MPAEYRDYEALKSHHEAQMADSTHQLNKMAEALRDELGVKQELTRRAQEAESFIKVQLRCSKATLPTHYTGLQCHPP